LISGLSYDHHDIYPTQETYNQAFRQFLDQSKWKIIWQSDFDRLSTQADETYSTLQDQEPNITNIALGGHVNRKDAWLSVQAVHQATQQPVDKLIEIINQFPGVSRRFEKIANNLYSDYAHTPEKIAGCLQLANEVSKKVVVVYEPLTNKRQYEISSTYENLFDGVEKLFWVPSYLTREDPNQPVLTPAELIKNMNNPEIAEPAELNDNLKLNIDKCLNEGALVVCLSGGGGGSLDEWLRKNFTNS
jgi:UDP-N-acetylmuramate--alanine ligase